MQQQVTLAPSSRDSSTRRDAPLPGALTHVTRSPPLLRAVPASRPDGSHGPSPFGSPCPGRHTCAMSCSPSWRHGCLWFACWIAIQLGTVSRRGSPSSSQGPSEVRKPPTGMVRLSTGHRKLGRAMGRGSGLWVLFSRAISPHVRWKQHKS